MVATSSSESHLSLATGGISALIFFLFVVVLLFVFVVDCIFIDRPDALSPTLRGR